MIPADFLRLVGPMAREAQAASGVPASVTIAQAILESAWGESELATKARALFGVKYGTKWNEGLSPYVDGSYSRESPECINGAWTTRVSLFCAYPDWRASVLDHGLFLRRPVYDAARGLPPDAYARAIHAAGYATDPGYSDKLIRLMGEHDLYRFDPQEEPMPTTPKHVAFLHSQQPGNRCEAGDTERDHMSRIVRRAAEIVRAEGHTVSVAPFEGYTVDGKIDFRDNVHWLNALHARQPVDFAWSGHSNAVGGSLVAYYPGNEYGRRIALSIKARLDPVVPDTCGVRDNLLVSEIAETDPTVVLTESFRHDTLDGARWIHANEEAIAQAHADGILDVIGRGAIKGADPLNATTPRTDLPATPPKEADMPTPKEIAEAVKWELVDFRPNDGRNLWDALKDVHAWSFSTFELGAKLDALAAKVDALEVPASGTVEPVDLDALADRIIARLAERMQS